jgi:hypothetical protein
MIAISGRDRLHSISLGNFDLSLASLGSFDQWREPGQKSTFAWICSASDFSRGCLWLGADE